MAGRAATAVKTKKSTKKTTAKASSTTESDSKDTIVSKKTVAAPKTRRRTKAETRTRIYWAVFNQDLKRVAVFEFNQKAEAESRAEALMKSSGNDHFIQKIKATVTE